MLREFDLFGLMQSEGLDYEQAEESILEFAKRYGPPSVTALDLLQQQCDRCISFGSGAVDNIFSGGLEAGLLTEIVGPPGSGKTQLCLQLVLSALDNDAAETNCTVVYIDTELAFSAVRLAELCRRRCSCSVEQLLKSVIIFCETTCDGLLTRVNDLMGLLPRLSSPCCLLIIDSLASLTKKQYDSHDVMDRASFLSLLGAKLKHLAVKFNLYYLDHYLQVVVTNQITISLNNKLESDVSEICDEVDYHDGSQEVHTSHVVPALGLFWTHVVNVRLGLISNAKTGSNEFLILKSPLSPNYKFSFRIGPSGILFEGSGKLMDATDPVGFHLESKCA